MKIRERGGRAAGLALLFCVLACPSLRADRSQGSLRGSFGQNQVVLKDFDWRIRRTPHFDVYYYEGSAPWVAFAAKTLESAYATAPAKLGAEFHSKRSFFLYANINDMEQSNIAATGDGVGGVTEPLKDRFMAWADGSENWLEDVIEHEYVHVIQFRVLVDGFWRSARVLKTNVYPLWFMEGMAEHGTGDDDRTMEDMVLRDAATSGTLVPLTLLQGTAHLKPHQVTLAYKEGAGAMNFLEDQYGPGAISAMLHIFKGRFDTSSVLQEVTGSDLVSFDRKFREYLQDKYALQAKRLGLAEPAGSQVTSGDDIPEFNTSPVPTPDGRSLVFLSTRRGYPPVVAVKNLETGEDRVLVGRHYDDIENIPTGRFSESTRQLAVSPDGRTVAFGAQKNHRDLMYLADLRNGRLSYLSFPGMMTVMEPAFSPDGRILAFSGMKDGRTDIYFYRLETGELENVTRSPEDDQSPAFSPDGRFLVYSSERADPGLRPAHQRQLMLMDLETRKARQLTRMDGRQRDPSFSPDGKRVLFTGDPDFVNDLYELDLEGGRVRRLTRSIGGSFNASYSPDGRQVLFASMRSGSIHVRRAERAELGGAEVVEASSAPAAGAPAASSAPASAEALSLFKKGDDVSRFHMSTDLFIPAFFFSSEGGLFWTSYWEASDYLGRHQISNFITYNSGVGYLNYNLAYAYTRYRPQWVVGAAGYESPGIIDPRNSLTYRWRINREFLGAAYPLDRYKRIELTAAYQSEYKKYDQAPRIDHSEARLLGAELVSDTVEGRYLVAVRGTRLRLGTSQSFAVLGGNQRYTSHNFQLDHYTPLGGQAALVQNLNSAFSFGPTPEEFLLGGVGGVRGYQQSLNGRTGTRVALLNNELRFPLVSELDRYLGPMFSSLFPDFLFKSLYGAAFYDVGYAWFSQAQINAATWRSLSQSAGLGVRVDAFVLQRFPFVLSADYAWQLTGRNKIFYIYLGPIF